MGQTPVTVTCVYEETGKTMRELLEESFRLYLARRLEAPGE